jgi:hypothetical protein
MALLQSAADSMEGLDFDERPIPQMTVEQALNVLRAHRGDVKGEGGHGPGRRARVRSLAEVRESIMTTVRAIEAMDAPDVPNAPGE